MVKGQEGAEGRLSLLGRGGTNLLCLGEHTFIHCVPLASHLRETGMQLCVPRRVVWFKWQGI